MGYKSATFFTSRVSLIKKVHFLTDICLGLMHLHACGIIHSRLQPLALQYVGGRGKITETQCKSFLNPIFRHYIPHEVFNRQKWSEGSDVYSFACVMGVCLTNQVPFSVLSGNDEMNEGLDSPWDFSKWSFEDVNIGPLLQLIRVGCSANILTRPCLKSFLDELVRTGKRLKIDDESESDAVEERNDIDLSMVGLGEDKVEPANANRPEYPSENDVSERLEESNEFLNNKNTEIRYERYGWRRVKNVIVPDQKEQEIIAIVKQKRDEGMKLRKIIEHLDSLGLKPRASSRKWHPATISIILKTNKIDFDASKLKEPVPLLGESSEEEPEYENHVEEVSESRDRPRAFARETVWREDQKKGEVKVVEDKMELDISNQIEDPSVSDNDLDRKLGQEESPEWHEDFKSKSKKPQGEKLDSLKQTKLSFNTVKSIVRPNDSFSNPQPTDSTPNSENDESRTKQKIPVIIPPNYHDLHDQIEPRLEMQSEIAPKGILKKTHAERKSETEVSSPPSSNVEPIEPSSSSAGFIRTRKGVVTPTKTHAQPNAKNVAQSQLEPLPVTRDVPQMNSTLANIKINKPLQTIPLDANKPQNDVAQSESTSTDTSVKPTKQGVKFNQLVETNLTEQTPLVTLQRNEIDDIINLKRLEYWEWNPKGVIDFIVCQKVSKESLEGRDIFLRLFHYGAKLSLQTVNNLSEKQKEIDDDDKSLHDVIKKAARDIGERNVDLLLGILEWIRGDVSSCRVRLEKFLSARPIQIWGDHWARFFIAKVYLNDYYFKSLPLAKKFAEESAKLGNASAMCLVGDLLEKEDNFERAHEMWSNAKDLGITHALFRLGLMYDNGDWACGPREHLKLYNDAAKRGNPAALNILGLESMKTKKYDLAKKLFTSAVKHGSFEANKNLANLEVAILQETHPEEQEKGQEISEAPLK